MINYDIIVIGTGLAGCSAALSLSFKGKKILLLEKGEKFGGTSKKSGGWMWIPNNKYMLEEKLIDNKEDCIQYMASLSYPDEFEENKVRFGLSECSYSMLEMYYDNSSAALDFFSNNNFISVQKANTYNRYHKPYVDKLFCEKNIQGNNNINKMTPDYNASNIYNKMPIGRTITPFKGFKFFPFKLNLTILRAQVMYFLGLLRQKGGFRERFMLILQLITLINSKYLKNGTGATLMGEIEHKIKNDKNIDLKLNKEVMKIIYDSQNNKVSGIILNNGETINASDAIIIANGGFAQDKKKNIRYSSFHFRILCIGK